MTTLSMSEPDVRTWLIGAIKAYAAIREEQGSAARLRQADELTATEVAVCVSDLLEAADIEIFELAAWQAWGPR